MSALLGSIEAFLPGMNFAHYKSRMDHLMAANDIVEESKKKSVAITLMGPICYGKLVSLLSPAKPESKTYKDIMLVLQEHYSETNNVISERCQFNMRFRREAESVEDYIIELKHMSEECNFGEFLDEALRDRLVSGINDQQIQSKLFLVQDLTWEKAKNMCIAEFRSRRNVKSMESAVSGLNKVEKKPETTVQRVQKKSTPRGKGKKHRSQSSSGQGNDRDFSCGRCGLSHGKNECRATSSTCRLCGKKGHWAAMCRTKSQISTSGNQHGLQVEWQGYNL
ncbi:uncharacterized protein LOC129803531 [Phlebotomus papatasi]|uniref:uncharacterized protein LOC129803531 n=1 Tax=Phlebotomus papatasi TaxID=29031 RepID=UPI0024846482|nr:uncharacterized protein LOC129803531 [Phlebotomus papatasi]